METHISQASSHSLPDAPTIALTGATGLIGSRLVPRLQAAGMHVRLLARNPQASRAGIEVVVGDLRDPDSFARLVDSADAVVHLGGIAHTSLRTEAERATARDINVGGTVRLLEAAKRASTKRFLLASTAHVYTGQQGRHLTENAPVTGDSFYSGLKLEAEEAVRAASAAGLHASIFRPCIVYGPGVRFNLASLMQAIRKGYYFHAGGVDPLRSFASVDTVAAAIQHLLSAGESGLAYNIADEEPVLLNEWTDRLAGMMGVRVPRTLPMPFLRSAARLLDPMAAIGLPAPLTTEKLSKLTASFSLDVTRLRDTGFAWPPTTESVLNEMVQAFLRT